MGHQTCIVQLPNSQLFCFSSYSSNSGCAYIFDLKIGDLQRTLPYTTPHTHSGGIYYNNAVYVFGGKINYSTQECCTVQNSI
ncbi:unnamed protein product [Blepharisma stoltei]|uniref:Recombination activating protein 2 n=1 Tax=Blepharisma stoltei TaxID=1481888 RepID=A0AAU9J625_9CILI|nr:unnamed protein product [Blepharisma stoltei]